MFQYFTNISCKLCAHEHAHATHAQTNTHTHTHTELKYYCVLEMKVDVTFIKTIPQLTMEKMDRLICMMMEQAQEGSPCCCYCHWWYLLSYTGKVKCVAFGEYDVCTWCDDDAFGIHNVFHSTIYIHFCVSAGNLFGFPSTSWWCSKTAHDYVYQWPVHSLQNTQINGQCKQTRDNQDYVKENNNSKYSSYIYIQYFKKHSVYDYNRIKNRSFLKYQTAEFGIYLIEIDFRTK